LVHYIWYHSIDPRVFLPQENHLGIFAITFLGGTLDNTNLRLFIRHTGVPVVPILGYGNLYFQIYTMWKIGFFNSPITSLKHVLWVKQSYLLQWGSKLHETSCIRNRIVCSILSKKIRISYPILDACHSIQVHSPE
jgi:hypothetical protein